MSNVNVKKLEKKVERSVKKDGFDPIRLAHDLGIKSSYCYVAGFVSIGLSFAAWGLSRLNPKDDLSRSDRWGIFVGEWAPTFFAVGLALRADE